MAARGTPAWYRRNDAPEPESIRMARRNEEARARGEFDEITERPMFEAFFLDSRRGRGVAYLAKAFERLPDSTYTQDSTQRHWHSWQCALGCGRPPPKFDPYAAAADRFAGVPT
jgi:hypothetical protein